MDKATHTTHFTFIITEVLKKTTPISAKTLKYPRKVAKQRLNVQVSALAVIRANAKSTARFGQYLFLYIKGANSRSKPYPNRFSRPLGLQSSGCIGADTRRMS